ncbi:MAG: hypothetical protein ACIAXF_17185 [Phycisphaerales bacterium JB063]
MSGIGPIVILIIVIGGWIIKAVNAMNESKAKREKSGNRPDYEELAARRRAELQQQAQQRGPATLQATQRDPSSMSMAERIEMARQRAQQQQGGQGVDPRAEALRRQQQEAMRQRQQQEQAARQQRLQQEQARRQQQQQQQQRARQQQQQQQQTLKQQRAAAKRTQQGIRQRDERLHRASHERVHKTPKRDQAVRKLEAALAPGRRPKRKGALLDFGKLNRRSLRQAMILKEVLDKPVALRDPVAPIDA